MCQGFGGCDPSCQGGLPAPESDEAVSYGPPVYDISDCKEVAPGSTCQVTCGKDYTVDDDYKNKPWLRFACPADTMGTFWQKNITMMIRRGDLKCKEVYGK